MILDHDYLRYYVPAPGDYVVDVGATDGEFVWEHDATLQGTEKLLVEANPACVGRIAQRIDAEKRADIAVLCAAVGTALSISDFSVTDTPWGMDALEGFEHRKVPVLWCRRVPCIPLGFVLSMAEPIAFLKMDIEGAELSALQSCPRALRDYVDNMAIAAYHIVDGEPTHKVLTPFLENVGYEVKVEAVAYKGQPARDILYARRLHG